MEKTSSATCTVSIYYDQAEWHHLILNFINPLLTRERISGKLKTYGLYLGNMRGDHIRLVINIAEEKTVFQEKLTELLHSFLTSHPSVKLKTQEYPIKGFFKDYENNSFWFDKYSSVFIIDEHAENINQRISECIIKALGGQEIEQEMIYTFMVYMQLGAIKAAYPDIKAAGSKMDELISYLDEPVETDEETLGDSTVYSNELTHLFENNKSTLVEILGDVWNENGYEEEIAWMESWVTICKLYIGQADFRVCYISLSKLIYRHLGFALDTYLLSLSSELILNAFNQCTEEKSVFKFQS